MDPCFVLERSRRFFLYTYVLYSRRYGREIKQRKRVIIDILMVEIVRKWSRK